jgi:TolA-binding protein
MVRRLLELTVLLGVVFYGIAGECFADVADQLRQAQQHENDGNYADAEAVYSAIVVDYPGADGAFAAQQRLVFLYLKWDKPAAEDAAFEKLVTDFAAREDLPGILQGQIGGLYRELAKYSKARKTYQYVINTWPQHELAVGCQAGVVKSYMFEGNEQMAEAATNELFSRFGGSQNLAEVACELGYECRSLKRWKRSQRLFQYFLDHAGQDDRAMRAQRHLAKASVFLGDAAGAEAAIDRLLSVFGTRPGVINEIMELGEDCIKTASYDKAVLLYQHVVDHQPGHEQAIWSQVGMAESYIGLGDSNKAQATTDKLLATYGDHADIAKAVDHVADMYREVGRYEKASRLYQYVVETWPDAEHTENARAGKMLADALGQISSANDMEVQAGLDSLAGIVNDRPWLPEAAFWKAEQYYHQGKYQRAIDLMELVSSESPESSVNNAIPFLLGTCYEELEDYPKAVENYEKSVAQYPDTRNAFRVPYRLGILYRRMKDYDKAVHWFEQQRQLYPTALLCERALFWQGMVYLHDTHQYQQARDIFQEYVEQYPERKEAPWAMYNRACCEEEMGNNAQATALLDQALQSYPDSIYAGDISRKLTELR